MIFVAAPIVRQPLEIVGAPGKTDFVRIFIADELNDREYRTTLRHEQAHVWSRHDCRRPSPVDVKVWSIACEMEIARTIYDAIDIDTITAPRSRLSGGYLPGSISALPDDLTLAEEIYTWLMEHPEEHSEYVSCTCCTNPASEDASDNIESPSKIVEGTRECLDEVEAKAVAKNQLTRSIEDIARRPPSLTEAIDAALRVRVERERSYRRPSRRHEKNDLLPAGHISTPRPPLVEIFVDRSGSFSAEKTAEAEQALSALLSRYRATIRQDVWFFGNGRLSSADIPGGGNTPYDLVANHIHSSLPRVAIVVTDDDSVDGLTIPSMPKNVSILCIPIGCSRTNLAVALGGVDVTR